MGRRKTPDEREIQALKIVNTELKRQVARLQRQVAKLAQIEVREVVEDATSEETSKEPKPKKGQGCVECQGVITVWKTPGGKSFRICKECKHREKV